MLFLSTEGRKGHFIVFVSIDTNFNSSLYFSAIDICEKVKLFV